MPRTPEIEAGPASRRGRQPWRRLALLATADGPGFVLYEPYNTGWAFYADNDALAMTRRDQQYTGGFALTLSGRRAAEYAVSLDPVLGWLDRVSGVAGFYQRGYRRQLHGLQLGLTAFTPEDTTTPAPIRNDRPYASLVFLANNRQTVLLEDNSSVQTTFALGLLGTRIPQELQDTIHRAIDSPVPSGWQHQVSDGGELTFIYGGRWQKALFERRQGGAADAEISTFVGGALGYDTVVVAGLNWRYGRINTPWWSFNPNYGVTINMGAPVAAGDRRRSRGELFLWGGLGAGYTLYNAFLQGQFRDSEVTFDRDEIQPWLLDLTLGLSLEAAPGLHLTFAVRAQSAPLREGSDAAPLWGGLIVQRSY